MNRRTRFSLSALIALLLPAVASAQEIEASVSVNTDQVGPSAQTELAGFGEELRRYVENTRWTDEEWEGDRLKMTFNVVVVGTNDQGGYAARLLVGSQRPISESEKLSPMMRVLDDGWSFAYVRNQPFIQDPTRYDELTGLIDFYVYLALGLDLDSYAAKGGSAMYQKAWSIAQRAQIVPNATGWRTDGAPGAYTRYNFVRELSDLRYAPLREFIYNYHSNGLDRLSSNRGAALDSLNGYMSDLVRAIDALVQPSTIVRVLNDTKNTEYAELFRDYIDPEGLIWRKLYYIDPAHKAVYDQARQR